MLLDMMREGNTAIRFAGIRVCVRAFQKLTGISAGTMHNIREKIGKGVVNISSNSGLAWMEIRNQATAKRYLDARVWLESYADIHGEKSPMSLQVFLPAGRKFFYHSQYHYERSLS